MTNKTTVQITKDNIEQFDIKIGTILKDNEGMYWRITDVNDFTAGMRVCDKDGNEIENFVGNAGRAVFGGGLSDLLNDGVATYFIETEQPEIKEEKNYNFFVKDTAEFEQFADFESITNLTAEEAVSKFYELYNKGFSSGIGINIPNDIVFDDPEGNGITIVVIDEENKANFAVFGDSLINDVNTEMNFDTLKTRISAYEELYNKLTEQNIPTEYPQFVFEKKAELEKMAGKTAIKITEDNIGKLNIKEGTVIKDDQGTFWKITKADGFMASMRVCNKDGSEIENFVGNAERSAFGGGLVGLLNDGVAVYYIEEENPEIHADNTVSKEEIEEEKKATQKQIQQAREELENPENAQEYAAYPQLKQEIEEYIKTLENLTNEDFKSQVLWKRENQRKNEESHVRVVEQMQKEREDRKVPKDGEFLSYNESHPTYSVTNTQTNREITIQTRGRLAENVRKLGKVKNLSEANNVIEKIKLQGFDILSTESRVIIYNKDKFYEFNDSLDSGKWNFETESFEYDFDARSLNGWDFKDYIKGGFKITKRMKEFEKIESAATQLRENGKTENEDYIHSEEFVSKFGDWEKANRLETLKNSEALIKDEKIFSAGEDITEIVESLIENEDRKAIQSIEKELVKNVAGTYINKDTGLYITVSNRNVTENSNNYYLQKEHIQAIQYIPEIIDGATFIEDVENEDKEKHPNIEKYKYFATRLNLNGTDFTCKTVVGVQKNGNCYYDQSLSSIETGKFIDIIQQKNKFGNLSPLITTWESEPYKPENLSPLITQREFGLSENQSPAAYYDKRLINICQVPQMPYLEMTNGKWQPNKETVKAVKEGKLFVEKSGQNYTMHDENQKPIYFNDLTNEQKEEVIDGYRMAEDQDMLTEWENILWKNLVQIKKDNPFISSFDIEKEISVAANPPSDGWISEYLQKNKVNFNTDFWQDIFAEMEAKPKLKTYHTLKESDVKGLEITPVSLEEILSVMEMKPEVTSEGKIKIYDQQRQEYIDNRSLFSDSDDDNWSFYNAAEIFERLDIYINDYFISDFEEQLEAGGVTLTGNETLKDLCDYAKEQLEAGITTISQDELNLAMGIVNPDTLIMPEGFIEQKKTTTFSLQNQKESLAKEEQMIFNDAMEKYNPDFKNSVPENIKTEQNTTLEQCNKIIEKYTNTHFTEQEQKVVNEYEKEDANRHQVLMSLCNMQYIHCTTKNKYGYWEINKGKEISANEVRRLMSCDDFASGVDRASFHITAGRTANDGSFIYFNDSERKRDIQPYELSKEDIELLSKYEEAGGLKENIPKSVLEQLSKTNNDLTAEDLKNARALLPKEQYQVVLGYTQGEEGEHFKNIIKEISSKAEAIKGKREILTENEKHPLAFKYTIGASSFYFSEWDGEDELFGYAVLNGDTQNSEWGYTSLEELKNAGGKDINGFPMIPEMIFYGLEDTIEKQISIDYPELSEKMGFAPKLNHNEELISEFGKEIFETLQSRKLEHNAYNICCAAQFVIRTMNSSEQKEIFSIMKRCGCEGKNGKSNTEDFLTEVVKAENNTASSVYDRKRLYEKINKACSQKKPEASKSIHNQESDYDIEI